MKAAVYKEKGILQIEDVPDPQIGPEEVLLKVSHVSICGSDLHRYKYGMLSPGSIMGHEYAGTVVAKGDEVTEFEIGDRVAMSAGKVNRAREIYGASPRYSAKEKGFYLEKEGAYAEYKKVHRLRITKTPESLSSLHASILEPLTIALHTVRFSKMALGDSVLVLGAGPIGLLTQQCASLSGALRLYVSETNATRRAIAMKLGATEVFDPLKVDIVEEMVKRTEIGIDVAFECAGAKPTLQNALEAVRIHGRVILVALAWEPVDCRPVDWVGREVELQAVYSSLPGDWELGLELLAAKKIDADSLITNIIPLKDIQAGFQELLKPTTDWVQAVVAFE